MTALNGEPGFLLARAFCGIVARIPADRSGVEQHIRTGQRHQAGGLWKPLVPTDHHTETSDRGGDGMKSLVAWCEIEFFLVARVLRNVHLAIAPGQRTIIFEYHRGIVVEAGGAAFEHRADHDQTVVPGQPTQVAGGGAGYRLGKVETLGIFGLAKIRVIVQFLQQDQVRAPRCRGTDLAGDVIQIAAGVTMITVLDEGGTDNGVAHTA